MAMLLLLLLGLGTPPAADRVDAARAVERARYAFVIGSTTPFDRLYPRSLFETRVEQELLEEAVLRREFGLTPTAADLAGEFDRIEKTTRAPEQWTAIKRALGDDRRLVEETFCRPLLVARTLRARFAFDPVIHEAPHQEARRARARLQAGEGVGGGGVVLLRRHPAAPATADQLLQAARSPVVAPRAVTMGAGNSRSDQLIDLDPEVVSLLERQLRRKGDVTTIVEQHDRFTVYRLIDATAVAWKVQAVVLPKVDFDRWLRRQKG